MIILSLIYYFFLYLEGNYSDSESESDEDVVRPNKPKKRRSDISESDSSG